MVFCPNCGTENEDDAVLCSKCHKKLYYTKKSWETKFLLIFGFLAFGAILIGIVGLLDDSAYIPIVPDENVSAYKSSCAEIDFNMPEDELKLLSWQNVKIKGVLLESIEGTSDRTNFKLKISNLTYYHYVDVSYSGKIPFKEGDKLEVYGEYSGLTIYDNGTAPFIRAAYIEKI